MHIGPVHLFVHVYLPGGRRKRKGLLGVSKVCMFQFDSSVCSGNCLVRGLQFHSVVILWCFFPSTLSLYLFDRKMFSKFFKIAVTSFDRMIRLNYRKKKWTVFGYALNMTDIFCLSHSYPWSFEKSMLLKHNKDWMGSKWDTFCSFTSLLVCLRGCCLFAPAVF